MNATLPDLSLLFAPEMQSLLGRFAAHRAANAAGEGRSFAAFEAAAQSAFRALARGVYAAGLESEDVTEEGVVVSDERV